MKDLKFVSATLNVGGDGSVQDAVSIDEAEASLVARYKDYQLKYVSETMTKPGYVRLFMVFVKD